MGSHPAPDQLADTALPNVPGANVPRFDVNPPPSHLPTPTPPHLPAPPPPHLPTPPHLPPLQHAFAHHAHHAPVNAPVNPPAQATANPPFSPVSPVSPSTKPRLHHRTSQDFRLTPATPSMAAASASASASAIAHASANANANGSGSGNGPMPVPGPHGRLGNGAGAAHAANLREMGFAGPRSPPNNKSTSHVPCKFYRQGACQAGKACPFLHSDEPVQERAPCKYFTKGNCKFGHKCALAHILPNGHVVNVNRNNFSGAGGGHFGRVNVPHHPEPAPNSSLLSMHMAPNYPPTMQDEYYAQQKSQYSGTVPTIETAFSSHPGSHYGSPPNDSGRLPISPASQGLTVMDVQLPDSFDPHGISHTARYGPIAASVPSRFFASSPPSSPFPNDPLALRNLHTSNFGDDSRAKLPALGSSPPDVEPPVGRHIMHSEVRSSRKGVMSASVGARPPLVPHDDWEDTEGLTGFGDEEDYLPSSLSELMTPQQQMRRFSRDHGDNDANSLSHRASFSKLGVSPTMSDTKFGSPSGATSSPSRFQSLWGKQPPRQSNDGGFESGSLPGVSAFGHVGSPLRGSGLHPNASPSLRPIARPTSGEANLFVSSPPRQASMSIISQQLQRTRLSSRASEEAAGGNLHPGLPRVTSVSNVGSSGRLGIDRAVSSSSFGRERIDEEQGLFSMEEEELERNGASAASNNNKRLGGIPWGKASPSIAPIGGHRTPGNPGTGPWGFNA